MLKKGDKNPFVKMGQEACEKLNIEVGPIDGDFGSLTETAFAEFKRTYLSGGDKLSHNDFALLLELAANVPDEDEGEVDSPVKYEDFKVENFINIFRRDCTKGYAWSKGGVESEYYKRYIAPWAENTKSYSKRYYPACAMGVHKNLKEAGLKLPYFYKGKYSFALVGNFTRWAKDLGIYVSETANKTIPKGSLILFGRSHIGMVPEEVPAGQHKFITCEVNRKRKVVEGERDRGQIDGFIPLKSLEA